MNILNQATRGLVVWKSVDYPDADGQDFIVVTGLPVHTNAVETVSDKDTEEETTCISGRWYLNIISFIFAFFFVFVASVSISDSVIISKKV